MDRRSSVMFAVTAAVLAVPALAADQGAPERLGGVQQQPAAQAPTVLASVNTAVIPAALNDQSAPAAPKRVRASRVTTCRCGGDPATSSSGDAAGETPADSTPQR